MSYEDLTCDNCGQYGDIICVECKLVGWDYCYCEQCIEDHVCWYDVRGKEEAEAAQEGA